MAFCRLKHKKRVFARSHETVSNAFTNPSHPTDKKDNQLQCIQHDKLVLENLMRFSGQRDSQILAQINNPIRATVTGIMRDTQSLVTNVVIDQNILCDRDKFNSLLKFLGTRSPFEKPINLVVTSYMRDSQLKEICKVIT